MFKNKKLIGLFAILGVLLAMAAAKKIFEGQRAAVEEAGREEESTAVLTQNILPEAVDAIDLYKGDALDRKIKIKKGEKGAWLLESRHGVPVREKIIPEFLNQLSNLKGSVRATSKNVFSDFKIGDKEGLHIILKNISGKDMIHLVVGANVPRWGACFARRADSDKVVMIEDKNILGSLGFFTIQDSLDDRSLGDYRLMTADVKNADRLEIILPKNESCVFVKSDGWKFEPPDKRAALDPAKVEDYLRILSECNGRDAVDPKGTGYGFESPQLLVKISFKEGAVTKTAQVQLGGPVEKEGMIYARVLPANLVYKIPENAALNLKQNKAHFLQAKRKK